VRDLSLELPGRPFIRGISLEIPPGKILGVAGVRDSGLETLERGITGFLKPSGPGFIRLNGRDITGRGSGAFREAGGAYLETGRNGEAAGALALWESLIIHCYKKSRLGWPGRFGVMDERYLRGRVDAILRRARISRSPLDRADSFSGGMLQRLFLARELEEEGGLLVLSEPGWGLDRVSRNYLRAELRARRKEGRGVLIFSTDVDELVEICDEILVLRNGIFSARLFPGAPEEAARVKEEIGRAMVGGN
jgi:simple sugar transport system ATP-binding protein